VGLCSDRVIARVRVPHPMQAIARSTPAPKVTLPTTNLRYVEMLSMHLSHWTWTWKPEKLRCFVTVQAYQFFTLKHDTSKYRDPHLALPAFHSPSAVPSRIQNNQALRVRIQYQDSLSRSVNLNPNPNLRPNPAPSSITLQPIVALPKGARTLNIKASSHCPGFFAIHLTVEGIHHGDLRCERRIG
jgi:hypothetical protein